MCNVRHLYVLCMFPYNIIAPHDLQVRGLVFWDDHIALHGVTLSYFM